MKKIAFIILCTALPVIFNGCTLTKYHIDSSMTINNAAALTAKNTPYLCSYRGRAAVNIESTQQNISFSILLNKKCSDDALINVLGALNNPAASIKYENKKVEVKTQSSQNTEDIKKIADKSIFHIISFFKTPQRLPESDKYSISFSNSSYIFADEEGNKLYADDKFRLYKYVTGNITSEYLWEEDSNILRSITVSSPQGKVTVKFLNKNGWSAENEG